MTQICTVDELPDSKGAVPRNGDGTGNDNAGGHGIVGGETLVS